MSMQDRDFTELLKSGGRGIVVLNHSGRAVFFNAVDHSVSINDYGSLVITQQVKRGDKTDYVDVARFCAPYSYTIEELKK